jgi:Flp pilus assembly pilin Flp
VLCSIVRLLRGERGQSSAEYLGAVVFVAALVVALVNGAPAIGGALRSALGGVIEAIAAGGGTGSGGGAPAPGGPASQSGGPAPADEPAASGAARPFPFIVITHPGFVAPVTLYGAARGAAALRSQRDLAWAWRVYRRTVTPLAARHGSSDARVLAAYYRWQQLIGARFARLHPGASAAEELAYLTQALRLTGHRGAVPSAVARLGLMSTLGSRAG